MEWGAKLGQHLLCSRAESPAVLPETPFTSFSSQKNTSAELGGQKGHEASGAMFVHRKKLLSCEQGSEMGQNWVDLPKTLRLS